MLEITRRQFGLGLAATAGIGRPVGTPALNQSGLGQSANRDASADTRPDQGSIVDVAGIRAGHFTESRRPTGCTALIFEEGATAGVDYDGSAPGETQVVLLQPVSPVEKIHALLLTGGGPMALGAVAGVVRYLEEKKIGYDWGVPGIRVPIVVGAVIDDLAVGDGRIRPDAEAAYRACQAAGPDPIQQGSVGAGSGATVGKMLRHQGCPGMKGGLGTVSLRLGDIVIGVLVVLNAAGDITDPQTGRIIAGARRPDGSGFADIVKTLEREVASAGPRASLALDDQPLHSTTLIVVATNVEFNKAQLTKIAMMANAGAARAIRPYHTTGDGDQLFAVSTNKLKSNVGVTAVGALAAEIAPEAIARAIKSATSVEGWPAYRDFTPRPTIQKEE